jgi:hypothetical protein
VNSDLFKFNSPRIASELIDGEYVIVDFDNGHYFNADQISSWILFLFANGQTFYEVLEEVKSKYPADHAKIEHSLQNYLNNLTESMILVKVDIQEQKVSEDLNSFTLPTSFVEPLLNKYTDLEELLLLDPIHDISPDTGWPKENK